MTGINKAFVARWVEALESGEYKQGKGGFHNAETGCFCVAGVALDLLSQDGLVSLDGTLAVSVVDGERYFRYCVTDNADSSSAFILPPEVTYYIFGTGGNSLVYVGGYRVTVLNLNDDEYEDWTFPRLAALMRYTWLGEG